MNKTIDHLERISLIRLSTSRKALQVDDGLTYEPVKSPGVGHEIEDGALRQGGAPNIYSKRHVGVLAQYLGMVLASTASAGMMVELSQREPESIRGSLQTIVWVASDLGCMVAAALVGFGLNSSDFGGSFKSSIAISGLMSVCTVVSALTAVFAWRNITEEKATRRSLRAETAKLFDLMQYKVVYSVLGFQLFKNMFACVSVTSSFPIQSVWAKVEPVNSSLASILTYLISAATLTFVRKYGLHWNWRLMVVAAQLSLTVIDVFPTMLTVWDVYRRQWLWLGLPLVEQLPANVGFIVSTFCVVEIMEQGNEAAFYGLASPVASLSTPFSAVITKNVDANFDIGIRGPRNKKKNLRTP